MGGGGRTARKAMLEQKSNQRISVLSKSDRTSMGLPLQSRVEIKTLLRTPDLGATRGCGADFVHPPRLPPTPCPETQGPYRRRCCSQDRAVFLEAHDLVHWEHLCPGHRGHLMRSSDAARPKKIGSEVSFAVNQPQTHEPVASRDYPRGSMPYHLPCTLL